MIQILVAGSLFWIIESGLPTGRAARAEDSPSAPTVLLPNAYWDAVEDARIPEPNEVFRNLTAITPQNSSLSRDKSGRVLVATWTRWDGYTQNIGNQLVLTQDLWVTVVPDLHKFCKHYSPTASISLAARLNQVLGLAPDDKGKPSRSIVEVWVDPRFLFRPSHDPEITDHEAELSFRPSSEFSMVPLSFQHWFYEQYDQRYQYKGKPISRITGANPDRLPYPWTQLGYTYDWGNHSDWAKIDTNRPKNVGLSEYVIRQWSPISVYSIKAANTYCQ